MVCRAGSVGGEFLGPHLTHGTAPLPLISTTPFLLCFTKHSCFLVPCPCPLCLLSTGTKTLFFPLFLPLVVVLLLFISYSFFLPCLTYNSIPSESLTLVPVATLTDVSGQFHSFMLDEWQCDRAHGDTGSMTGHQTPMCQSHCSLSF